MTTTKKFSVIVPVHNRLDKVKRTLKSLNNQTYWDFEVVLVDDASDDETHEYLEKYQFDYNDVKLVTHKNRKERVASRNDGMKESTGEWICWLDSDDEYMSNYLEVLNDAIDKWPKYKIFNFGSVIHWHRNEDEFYTKVGQPFMMEEPHENFSSGTIGTGRFIFHRSILDEIPLMKPALRPYGDPGAFPELNRNPNYPMREDGQWVPMGNPWGEDYHWFWLMTRKHETKTLNMLLYIEYRRKHGE